MLELQWLSFNEHNRDGYCLLGIYNVIGLIHIKQLPKIKGDYLCKGVGREILGSGESLPLGLGRGSEEATSPKKWYFKQNVKGQGAVTRWIGLGEH